MPAADDVYRYISRKADNQTTLPTPSIRILFEYLPAQQSFFDLGEG